MSTYSTRLNRLTAEFPADAEAVRRLLEFLDHAAEGKDLSLTAGRIFDVAQPRSQRSLALILDRLIEDGVLKQIIAVEFGDLGAIEEFSTLSEVPDRIHDWRRDVEVDVQPENLKLYYRLAS